MPAHFQAEDLTIEAEPEAPDGVLRLIWRGRSGARNPSAVLLPYFEVVLSEAVTQKHSIEMHFQGLDHFNSSTVAALIRLIQNARGQKVPLVFLYNQTLKWQKLSFDAMRVFVKSDGLLQMRAV